MKSNLLAAKIAGFTYNGKEIGLIPSQMKKVSDTKFEQHFDKGLKATLLYEVVWEDAAKWVVWLENTGNENTYQITKVNGIDIGIPCGQYENVMWRSIKGDFRDENTFMPLEEEIKPGMIHGFAPTGGRSSQRSAFPFFDLTYGDLSLVCGIGWSGQWKVEIERKENVINITAGQGDCDFYLEPEEKIRTPSALFLFGSQDVVKTRQAFRRLMRDHYSPAAYLGGKVDMPITLQIYDTYSSKEEIRNKYRYNTEETQIKVVKIGKQLEGIDTMWIDAIWFKDGFPTGVGNYTFASGFPNEFGAIPDEARRCGQRFMAWFEPERINVGSETYQSMKEIPNRFLALSDLPLNPPPARFSDAQNRLLNLGDTETRKWVFNTLAGIIRRNHINIYRQDFNMDPLYYWRNADEEKRKGITENKYIQGLYWLWDSLIKEFPKLLIDNCASGGRRIDFETCMRSVPVWRSDTGCSPDSEENPTVEWDQNQTMGISRYLPYHNSCSFFEDAYHFRSAATMGVCCDFKVLEENYDLDAANEALKEMKIIKPHWEGDFYPLTEQTNDHSAWSAYQLNNGDAGICMFFRRSKSEISSKIFKLRDLEGSVLYKVIFHDEKRNSTEKLIPGEELLNGVEIPILEKQSSLLVEYCKVTSEN